MCLVASITSRSSDSVPAAASASVAMLPVTVDMSVVAVVGDVTRRLRVV